MYMKKGEQHKWHLMLEALVQLYTEYILLKK